MYRGRRVTHFGFVPAQEHHRRDTIGRFYSWGGWSTGDKRARAEMVDFPALLDAGFTVATLDYRLAPKYKFPAMIQEVKCATRYLRAHAADYRIDASKIGVWGDSAGGHLVNMLGTTAASAGFRVSRQAGGGGSIGADGRRA